MFTANDRPPILISETDKLQLRKLARSAFNRMPEIVDELEHELERAETCPPSRLPHNVVCMHSLVRFRTDKGTEHQVELVYPEEADIIRDRLSILTPIGTALIGLSEGQTMSWTDRQGQPRQLTVLEVWPAERE
ncbi:nucleoside diphosphate kinase regulator [Aestuariivirga sp.]|uniref:nucleoside diphosphate kinase regulator n=1 Tax=Aestuariivirga sp. TaxID=2650926 RepID=UPI003918D67B